MRLTLLVLEVRTLASVLAAMICFWTVPAEADLLVSSTFNNGNSGQVLRYDEHTGAFLGVFTDTFTGGQAGTYGGMEIGPDGHLYVTKTISTLGAPGKVQRYELATGAFLDDFVTLGSGGLTRPHVLRFGPDENLYLAKGVFAGIHDDSILRYDGTSGAFLAVVVPPGGGEQFNDFVFGPDGNLYAAASAGNVLRYNGTTGAFLGLFAGGIGGDFRGLVFGPDGNLYVTDDRSSISTIRRFDGTTGVLIDNFVSPGGGGLFNPDKLLFGPDGNLYVSNTGTNSVKRFDGATGAFLGDFVVPGSGGLSNPGDLLFIPSPEIPEPATVILLSAGLLSLIGYSCWRKRAGVKVHTVKTLRDQLRRGGEMRLAHPKVTLRITPSRASEL